MNFEKEAREILGKYTTNLTPHLVGLYEEEISQALRRAFIAGQEEMRERAATKASEAFVKYATPQSVSYTIRYLPIKPSTQ